MPDSAPAWSYLKPPQTQTPHFICTAPSRTTLPLTCMHGGFSTYPCPQELNHHLFNDTCKPVGLGKSCHVSCGMPSGAQRAAEGRWELCKSGGRRTLARRGSKFFLAPLVHWQGRKAAGVLTPVAPSVHVPPMLGLVQYSDSEDEREEAQTAASDRQQLGAAATAAAAVRPQQQVQARPAPASGLPSAADLLEGGALQVRLPPPDFGQGPAAAAGRQQVGLAPAAAAGAKRGHPDTRGPLPNPMSLDAKVPRRWVYY